MSKKYGGVIKLTYELLEEFLAIEDAKIIEVWDDRDDYVYIKLRNNKESKYTVPMHEGDCYYHHRLNSEDIKNIWKEKLNKEQKKGPVTFTKSYNGWSGVDIHAINLQKQTDNTLRAISYSITKDPETKTKTISGTLSIILGEILPSDFDVVLRAANDIGKLAQMTLFGVKNLIPIDEVSYTFTADKVKNWEVIDD